MGEKGSKLMLLENELYEEGDVEMKDDGVKRASIWIWLRSG